MDQVVEDLNLSFLLENEREMILKVLQKDEKLRKREEKRIRWGFHHSNSCSSPERLFLKYLMFCCFCPTGSWRMSYWRSNIKVLVDPRSWESDSVLAVWRLWAWSSIVAISARRVSYASAMTAALQLPTHATGSVTFVPRSRKCDACRDLNSVCREKGKDSRWFTLDGLWHHICLHLSVLGVSVLQSCTRHKGKIPPDPEQPTSALFISVVYASSFLNHIPLYSCLFLMVPLQA